MTPDNTDSQHTNDKKEAIELDPHYGERWATSAILAGITAWTFGNIFCGSVKSLTESTVETAGINPGTLMTPSTSKSCIATFWTALGMTGISGLFNRIIKHFTRTYAGDWSFYAYKKQNTKKTHTSEGKIIYLCGKPVENQNNAASDPALDSSMHNIDEPGITTIKKSLDPVYYAWDPSTRIGATYTGISPEQEYTDSHLSDEEQSKIGTIINDIYEQEENKALAQTYGDTLNGGDVGHIKTYHVDEYNPPL